MKKILFWLVLFAVSSPGLCKAGILVTDEGRVYVGQILLAEDIEEDSIYVRWPYKGRTAPSEFSGKSRVKFDRAKVRWFDPRNDDLTLKYWEKHGSQKIDEKFKPRKEVRERITQEKAVEKLVKDFEIQSNQKLSKTRETFKRLRFYPPENWELSSVRQAFILKAPKADSSGFKARIHIVSCRRIPGPSPEINRKILSWIQELVDGQDFLEKSQKIVPISADIKEVQTTLTFSVNDKLIKTKRYLILMPTRIYFISCYASVDSFGKQVWLFDKFREAIHLPNGKSSDDQETVQEKKAGDK